MRGNNVMAGYYDNPAATEEAFRGGWFHSGDIAVAHEDGYVDLQDRAKDIIISGGENISSIEVEDCLYRHPAVLEAVGYDSERLTGWAFGVCIDRIAILKYRVEDIRAFYDNDLRLLEQFPY